MSTPDQDRVTCPSCGKGYRWKPSLVGQAVPCKQCGTAFEIPGEPGPGQLPQPADDDGMYELASNPDLDAPPPPPAYQPPPSDKPAQQNAPPPTAPTAPAESSITAEPSPTSSILNAEQPAYVSDETKAARREELRIAAAEAASARSWRDYKWLIIVLALLCLFGIIYWAMYLFSDAVDEGLHNVMLPDREVIVAMLDSHLHKGAL